MEPYEPPALENGSLNLTSKAPKLKAEYPRVRPSQLGQPFRGREGGRNRRRRGSLGAFATAEGQGDPQFRTGIGGRSVDTPELCLERLPVWIDATSLEK